MKYSYNALEKMTVNDLKEIMRDNGIKPLTGRKNQLIDRISSHFMIKNSRTRDSKNRKYDAPESEHLTNKVKAKKIEGDKTMYFQRKEIRVTLDKARQSSSEEESRELYNEVAEKLKVYVGTDRREHIVNLLVDYYNNVKTNLTEMVVLLDTVIGIFINEMTYAQLERYLVPAFTRIATDIQYSGKKYKSRSRRFSKTLSSFVKKGFDVNTVLVTLARSEAETVEKRIIYDFITRMSLEMSQVNSVLTQEKEYLISKINVKIRVPKRVDMDDPDGVYLLLTQIDYLMSKVDKILIV